MGLGVLAMIPWWWIFVAGGLGAFAMALVAGGCRKK